MDVVDVAKLSAPWISAPWTKVAAKMSRTNVNANTSALFMLFFVVGIEIGLYGMI